MNIITGYVGEPHITSAQDRGENQGAYGTGSYVLNVGSKLAATTPTANEVRIADGLISHQGCVGIIEVGTYDSVAIDNGTQGMNRIDLIVARYTRNTETNVESLALVAIKGTPTSGNPSAPSYTSGNIQSGAAIADMPLYQVLLTGITITSVTRVFNYVRTQAELTSDISTLNGKLSWTQIANEHVTGNISKSISQNILNYSEFLFVVGVNNSNDINYMRSYIIPGSILSNRYVSDAYYGDSTYRYSMAIRINNIIATSFTLTISEVNIGTPYQTNGLRFMLFGR